MDAWGLLMQVSPFRYLRLNGYLLLPAAFRSLSRLSSALSAKASTLRSFLLDLSCRFHSVGNGVFSRFRAGDLSPFPWLPSCYFRFVFSDVLIKRFFFFINTFCMKFSRYNICSSIGSRIIRSSCGTLREFFLPRKFQNFCMCGITVFCNSFAMLRNSFIS